MLNAVFHTSVAHIRDLPRDSLAEVAFVGRSNAGKSSAINALANQKRLAYVSKTPGRTQLLNYFRLETGRYLVDLPGYGYARAPLAQQHNWQSLIGAYLAARPPLKGLVLIMDVRHPLTDLDVQLLDWWKGTGKPVLVLLSKSDKLSRGVALSALREVQAYLQAQEMQGVAQLFSSLRRVGLDEAESVVRDWLQMPKKTRLKGIKPGTTSLNMDVKAPAQGGEAGDEATHL